MGETLDNWCVILVNWCVILLLDNIISRKLLLDNWCVKIGYT